MIIVMAALFAVTLVEEGAYDRGPFGISYELDGGINDDRNPSSYMRDDGAELLPAWKEGMAFDGWYIDSDLLHRISGIRAGTTGDITLYAGWADDRSGTKTSYVIDGYSEDGTRTWKFQGSLDVSLMYHSSYRLAYYMQIDHSVDVTEYMFGSIVAAYPDSGSSSAWSSAVILPRTYIGSETIHADSGDVLCSVYSTASSDGLALTIWICDDDSTVYRVQADGDSVHFTMGLTGQSEIAVVEHVSITVRGDRGIIACGDGSDVPGTILTLTAEGEGFSGWYDFEGNLISFEPSFGYEIGTADVELYARGSGGPIAALVGMSCTLDTGFVLSDAVWEVHGDSGPVGTLEGSNPPMVFESAGTYIADATGTLEDGSRLLWRVCIVCDGDVVREHAWTYDGAEYTLSWAVPYSAYLGYRGMSQDERSSVGDGSLVFATPSDPLVASVASTLWSKAVEAGMDAVHASGFVLSFVQSFEADGTGEWKYPAEVLFECSGNDRSCSALFASMMSSLGFRSSLLLFPGHTAAGMEIDGAEGVFYSYGGIKYRYCECSPSADSGIGEKPEGVANRVSKVLEIRSRQVRSATGGRCPLSIRDAITAHALLQDTSRPHQEHRGASVSRPPADKVRRGERRRAHHDLFDARLEHRVFDDQDRRRQGQHKGGAHRE